MTVRGRLTVFFSVGEPSGDLHGANLIPAVCSRGASNSRRSGYGGPEMEAAGCRLHADLTALAVMWFAPRPHQSAQVLGTALQRRPLFPHRPSGRCGADQLPGLQLVDRSCSEAIRHPRILLHSAANLGLGELAGEEDAAAS